MVRKTLAIVTATAALMLSAGPAEAEKSSLNPAEELQDLVNGVNIVNSGSGAIDVSGARGTAWSSVVGVRLSVGDDVDLRILDTLITATTDHQRLEANKNFARGEASIATAFLRDEVYDPKDPNRHRDIPERLYGESFEGENTQNYCLDPMPEACVGEQPLKFPPASTPLNGSIDWDGLSRDVQGVVSLITGVKEEFEKELGSPKVPRKVGDIVLPIPSGQQAFQVDAGVLVDGLSRPASIETRMTPNGSFAGLESSIKRLVMFGGLSSMQEAGPGSQRSSVDATAAQSETKLLKIEQMTVLQTDALLTLLGLNSDQLPDETLASLADAMGISAGRFASTVANARNWSSVKELEGAVADLYGRAQTIAGLGTCDVADRLLQSTAADFQIAPPNCLGGGVEINRFVTAVTKLRDDVHNALASAVGEESLLSITDLSASVTAVAGVRPAAPHDVRASVHGGIQEIRAAGGVQKLDVKGHADEWNAQEEFLNGLLNGALTQLGPEFKDVVRVRLMPELTEAGRALEGGKYIQSEASMTLMKVFIDLPGADAVRQAVERLVADATAAPGHLPSGDPLGGGGGGSGPLGRAAPTDPITITIGEMSSVAEHTRPGVTVPDCKEQGKVCDLTSLNTSWDPDHGWGGSGPADGDLPRTGSNSGTLPIVAAAALGAPALIVRRFAGRHAGARH